MSISKKGRCKLLSNLKNQHRFRLSRIRCLGVMLVMIFVMSLAMLMVIKMMQLIKRKSRQLMRSMV